MVERDQLTAQEIETLLPRIAAWRADPDVPVACPRCEALGLALADHSARPHTEWYGVRCAACGLDAMINIPLGARVPGAQD